MEISAYFQGRISIPSKISPSTHFISYPRFFSAICKKTTMVYIVLHWISRFIRPRNLLENISTFLYCNRNRKRHHFLHLDKTHDDGSILHYIYYDDSPHTFPRSLQVPSRDQPLLGLYQYTQEGRICSITRKCVSYSHIRTV